MRRSIVLFVCFLLFSASPVRAEFYRWVDGNGNESITDDREKIPQEYRGSAAPVKTDGARVSVGGESSASGKARVPDKEHKDKYGKGEEFWRKRAMSLRRELNDLQAEHDVLARREQQQENNPAKTSGKKAKAAASRDKKKIQLERKIAVAKRRLEVDLPEEARRADAYPGWIRE